MTDTPVDVYEVYAIRYGTRDARSHEHFVFRDIHDGPMPMDYFVWAIKGDKRTFVVDTGYGKAEGEGRGRKFLRCPTEGLRAVGVEAKSVTSVIITHLHYDHGGNLGKFPNACFHVQDAEVAYATGRPMSHRTIRGAYTVDHVTEMVRLVYDDRVIFHQGDVEIASGVRLHHIGGHTRGLQAVSVHTRRGMVVLASDASHYYANMEQANPFPIVDNVFDMLEGHRRLQQLAESAAHIVPGHDPEVMRRYPAASAEANGIAVSLHEPPAGDAKGDNA